MRGAAHGSVSLYVDIYCLGLCLVCLLSVADSQISGSVKQCSNEGEEVFEPILAGNPCIKCFCQNGEVRCRKERCRNLEGCYVILFESLRDKRKCCEMCKGCLYENKQYKSGDRWLDQNNPCVTLTCRAGVITRSTQECHAPCTNPVKVKGQCCPVCRGCTYNGQTHKDGAEFPLATDNCTKCKCQEGKVKCSKEACPLMNCPENVIFTPKGQCCPTCQGKRRIFNLPRGRCFFRNKIYRNGEDFRPGGCVHCVCIEGTVICDRKTCPALTCPIGQRVTGKDPCCETCPVKVNCEYEGKIYQDTQRWQPDICTSCSCDDGATRCRVQQCRNSVWCPTGYKLRYVKGECCPRCVEAIGVCTVFGDPHYRTFDGKIYNFQGACKYLLAEDKRKKSFSIRVKNDARTSPWFTWTRMLTINLGNTKIGLHQKLVVKVNRKRVKLPYRIVPDFSIERTGSNVIVDASIGVKVTWDGDSFVEVTVSSKFKRGLTGLCGNYNGIGSDDLVGRDKRRYFDSNEFGNTWRVGSKAACAIDEQFKHESKTLCKKDTKRKRKARKACNLLLGSVFTECRRKVDVKNYYRSCIDDMCDCPKDKFCACESFKAYSLLCSQEGILTNWEKYRFCPAQCPEKAIFKRCTRKCPRTCKDPVRTGFCRQQCQPGCLCPSRRVLHDNKCILQTECPAR